MGSSFSNIQVRYSEPIETNDIQKLAGILTNGRNLSNADKEEEADIVVTVCISDNSPWITITSDIIDGDVDAQLKCAQDIAKNMQKEVMAISCFDSDYLFLNLIDPKNNKDMWAAYGHFPYGKAPRRSNLSAWKDYVSNASDFSRVMHSRFTFAEECLNELEPLLSLSVSQSTCNIGYEPANAKIIRFYYNTTNKDVPDRLPVFKPHCSSVYYKTNGDLNFISFLNHGDAFRGVAICLYGPCIAEHQVCVKSIELQHHDAHGGIVTLPVSLEEKTFSNGITGLYGKIPTIRVPSAVPEGLPCKKKMDMEFQRSVGVRFFLNANVTDCLVDNLGDLYVTLIPLPNFSGQSGWIMKHFVEDDMIPMK